MTATASEFSPVAKAPIVATNMRSDSSIGWRFLMPMMALRTTS